MEETGNVTKHLRQNDSVPKNILYVYKYIHYHRLLWQFLQYRQYTYTYKRRIEVRTCNHCCLGKTISIIYSKCVSVALDIRHEKRMELLWFILLYHIFPRHLINHTILGEKMNWI